MSILEVCQASFGYTERTVFEKINLTVDKGEIFCLLGPNGCGKTTLLDCILGLLKIKEGHITVNGINTAKVPPHLLARQVAYVPQIHKRTFPYRVLDVVLMGRVAYTGMFSTPDHEDQEIAEKALQSVGLLPFKDRLYTQLSGGEGQLVMIARALAQQTPIIIMDEPTAHLDFKRELTVLETIVQLVKKNGLSLVMATHFPNHAFYMDYHGIKTTVALMNNGHLAVIGDPDTVLTETNMRETFQINASVLSYPGVDGRKLKQIVSLNTLS